MFKQCIVCGGTFKSAPSSKKITCSKSCSAIRKRESHLGKSNAWSDTSRAALSSKGQTPSLALGTPAARKSTISGPFETNQEAKVWVVQSPDGDVYEVRNLRLWCRENSELFEPDAWELAYAGLRQVQAWLIGKRARQVGQWKNWTLLQPNTEATNT